MTLGYRYTTPPEASAAKGDGGDRPLPNDGGCLSGEWQETENAALNVLELYQ